MTLQFKLQPQPPQLHTTLQHKESSLGVSSPRTVITPTIFETIDNNNNHDCSDSATTTSTANSPTETKTETATATYYTAPSSSSSTTCTETILKHRKYTRKHIEVNPSISSSSQPNTVNTTTTDTTTSKSNQSLLSKTPTSDITITKNNIGEQNNNNIEIKMPPQTYPTNYVNNEIPAITSPGSTDSSLSLNYLYTSSSLNSYTNTNNNNNNPTTSTNSTTDHDVGGTISNKNSHHYYDYTQSVSSTKVVDNTATHPLGRRNFHSYDDDEVDDHNDDHDSQYLQNNPPSSSNTTTMQEQHPYHNLPTPEKSNRSSPKNRITHNSRNNNSNNIGGSTTTSTSRIEGRLRISFFSNGRNNDNDTTIEEKDDYTNNIRDDHNDDRYIDDDSERTPNRNYSRNYHPKRKSITSTNINTTTDNCSQTEEFQEITVSLSKDVIHNTADNGNNDEDDNNNRNEEKEEKEDEKINPLFMYQYLQNLGDRRKEALEKFYSAAVENPCQSLKCGNPLQNMWQTCNFMSPQHRRRRHHHNHQEDNNFHNNEICQNESYTHDPFDRNIVGPRSCEYCNARTTLQCTKDCPRPKLFFLRKKPPFENQRNDFESDGLNLFQSNSGSSSGHGRRHNHHHHRGNSLLLGDSTRTGSHDWNY